VNEKIQNPHKVSLFKKERKYLELNIIDLYKSILLKICIVVFKVLTLNVVLTAT
jgi:hypothetical protein